QIHVVDRRALRVQPVEHLTGRDEADDGGGPPLYQGHRLRAVGVEILGDVVTAVAGAHDHRPSTGVPRRTAELTGVHHLTLEGGQPRQIRDVGHTADTAGGENDVGHPQPAGRAVGAL